LVCRPLFKESAKIIGIGKGVEFDNGCNIVMRDHANIGSYSNLGGPHATITIGRHVMMGTHCNIICQNHKYLEEGFDGFEGKDVLIDDFAWIGDRVIILPGVRIGKHAIIGAGAVVPKDIPDYAIAVGNPAVVKKYRKIS
jgi:maltose O-acetyltransferase